MEQKGQVILFQFTNKVEQNDLSLLFRFYFANMNILIDIGHPAQAHLLKGLAEELKRRNHTVYFSTRNIPVAQKLLKDFGFDYYYLGKKGKSIIGKGIACLKQEIKLYRFIKKHKIDLGLNAGLVLARAGKYAGIPTIGFCDDDQSAVKLLARFGHTCTTAVLQPDAINDKADNIIHYAGTHELAYLHPNRFKPDPAVLKKFGIEGNYFILRFVAFNAYHDVGQRGLSLEMKQKLIDILSPHGRVFITSEKQIEPELEKYCIKPMSDIHSLMYYSSMFIGDSQTMTSEAGLFGVPAFKCNTFAGKLSVPNMMEEYGLCKSYQPEDFDRMCQDIKATLEMPNYKDVWQSRLHKFLSEKIDVTQFFVWFVENFPESKEIMKTNPDYQYQFK